MKVVFAFLVSLLLALSASAQPVDKPCGIGGTAKSASGELVTKTDAEALMQNAHIKADGYWWTCPKVRAVAPPPPPKNCYAPDQGFRSWEVNGNKCSTVNRYATSPTDPARDRMIEHGRIAAWTQWQGSVRGQLVERCTDGVRTVVASTCAPVTHCDVKFSTTNDGGLTNYVYDARPMNSRVAIGESVDAVTADGRKLRIQCVAGDFKQVRSLARNKK